MKDKIVTEKIAIDLFGGSTGRRTQICPYVGLKEDAATALAFPSLGNHCYHAKPVLPVKLEAQRIFCLSANYTICEQFSLSPDSPLSPGLRSSISSRQSKIFNKSNLWIPLLFIAVVGLITWQVLSRGLFGVKIPGQNMPIISTVAGVQTMPVALPKAHTPTPTFTLMPSDTPLPSLTFTPMVESPHALETPIGIQYKVIIHQVVEGESLPFLASKYWTTTEAIQAVNFYLPTPITVGLLVIIPPNQTDVSGMPAFEAYQVKADVSGENLAQQLSIDPAMLKIYNALNDAEILHADEWLVIPHMGTAIP
jgi:hypothetical protein